MTWYDKHLSAAGIGLAMFALRCGGASTGGGNAMDASVDAPSTGDAAACSPSCGEGRDCCGTKCVNTANDPLNCGGCGVTCSGATPYCEGSCKPTPCSAEGGSCA